MNKLIKTFLFCNNIDDSQYIILNKNMVLDKDDEEEFFRYYDNHEKMYKTFINIIKNNNYILDIIEREIYGSE